MNNKGLVKTSREQIKEKILQAAITEFSLHGFVGASTQGIALRAGMKKSQLHYYIEDKEALYYQVLETIFNTWDALFEYDPEQSDTPEKTLSKYISQKFDFAVTYPELSRVFTMEVVAGGRYLEAYWDRTVSSALIRAEIIDSWVKAHKIRRLDGRLLLMNIWAMTQHYADYAVQSEKILKKPISNPQLQEEIKQELITFVLSGIALTD